MRDRHETDNILFGLNRAYTLLSNRSMPDDARESWLKALRPYPTDLILDAIDAHVNGDSGTDSKYAPKPKHIIDLIKRSRDHLRGMERPAPQEEPAPPHIAKAWVIAMAKFHGWAPQDNNPELEMSVEESIEIVNAEAKKYNRMDAIPKEYRL